MNIAITFRQMEATEAVKTYATEKVARLQKFLRRPMKCQVTLSCKDGGRNHYAEVDVHSGDNHFHAHEQSEDMYATNVTPASAMLKLSSTMMAANVRGSCA